MKIKLIKEYHLSDSDLSQIKNTLNFAVAPYICKTNEEGVMDWYHAGHSKAFNSLKGGERVYSQGMIDFATDLLNRVKNIIAERLEGLLSEPVKSSTYNSTANSLRHRSALEGNYKSQTRAINDILYLLTHESLVDDDN